MTFGRWLLVHSFSIALVGLLIVGYIYREELNLQQAYHQLMSLSPDLTAQTSSQKIPPVSDDQKTQQAEPVTQEPTQAKQDSETQTLTQTSEKAVTTNVELTPPPTLVLDDEIQLDKQLLAARQAYWDKRFEDSIQHYQQLIRQQPRNPDLYGELGNVFYALNNYPRAADLFYRAAELLIEQNERQRAGQLVAPISAMQRELGGRLRERLKEE